jgi:hypothetical protein
MKRDIIISINEPPRPDDKRRKGIVRPQLRSKYFARRLSSEIFLNYYDLGWNADGTDIDFNMNGGINFFRLDAPEYYYNLEYAYGDYTTNLFNYFNGIGRDNWASQFMKIDSTILAEYYGGVSFTGSANYVSGRGFRPPQVNIDLNLISINGLYTFFNSNTIQPSNFKITSIADYSASAVSFTLDRSCDIFLLPRINFYEGMASFTVQADSLPRPIHHQFLNLLLKAESRELTMNNATYDGFKTSMAAYETATAGNRWLLPDTFDSTYHAYLVNYFKTVPNNRMFEFVVPTSGGGLFSYTEADSIGTTAASFRSGTDAGYNFFNSVDEWWFGPFVSVRPWHLISGCLVMVIKKGSDWFYVWQVNTTDVSRSTFVPNTGFPDLTPFYRKNGGVKWVF